MWALFGMLGFPLVPRSDVSDIWRALVHLYDAGTYSMALSDAFAWP